MKRVLSLVIIIFLLPLFSGCAVTGGSLIESSYEGKTADIKDMLDKGADVNMRGGCGLWSVGGDFDATPLQCAALGGHLQAAKELIDRGADVNARGDMGNTPLLAAAYGGHTDIVKLLIENGADTDYAMARLGSGKNQGFPEAAFGFDVLARYVNPQQPSVSTETLAGAPRQEAQAYSAIRSDIDELPLIKIGSQKDTHAIIIGIEQYRQKLPKADFAVSDAKLMSRYLNRVMGCPEENIVTLTNEHAALGDFIKYFEKWLPNNAEKGGTVFVYYSGHGAPDPKSGGAYLVPYDGDPAFIAETGFSLKRMYGALGKLPAKEIIVALDSCFSGAGGRSVIAKGARPLVMNLQSDMALPKNMTVLSASSGEQISSTYDEKGHGLFTYFLLKGIKNEDVVNPDGSINMDDLFGYLAPQVARIARKQYNNEQTPQLIGATKD